MCQKWNKLCLCWILIVQVDDCQVMFLLEDPQPFTQYSFRVRCHCGYEEKSWVTGVHFIQSERPLQVRERPLIALIEDIDALIYCSIIVFFEDGLDAHSLSSRIWMSVVF